MPSPPFPPPRSAGVWASDRFALPYGERTLVMGILNCTPDSFSDGGRYLSPEHARARLHELESEGADLIDVGAESSRPGSVEVPVEEELRRLEPVLDAIASGSVGVPVSIDTRKSAVARAALRAGCAIVNDISALRHDPEMASVVSEERAGLVLMHMQGDPSTMQREPSYAEVVAEVAEFLDERVARARAEGVPAAAIVLDPGLGFGKTVEHNLALLTGIPRLAAIGLPVLIGASRKRFLGALTGLAVDDRAEVSVAAHLAAALAGAHIVRVHDVRPTVEALRVIDALHARDRLASGDACLADGL